MDMNDFEKKVLSYMVDFKKYYDEYYTGQLPLNEDALLAAEMLENDASILIDGKPYDEEEMYEWVTENRKVGEEEVLGKGVDYTGYVWDMSLPQRIQLDKKILNTEMGKKFPDLFNEDVTSDGVAAYFMEESLEIIRKKLNDGDEEFIKVVGDLGWQEMIEEVQDVKDVFLF